MHFRFVQVFDKDLKCLIYLGYWRRKHWKYLLFQNDAKTDIDLVCKAELVRKQFLNPKSENKIFSYIICTLDFKNISITLFLLYMKTMNGVVWWYILLLALHHLFYCVCFVSFYLFLFFCLKYSNGVASRFLGGVSRGEPTEPSSVWENF